jgi:hypothetical protein
MSRLARPGLRGSLAVPGHSVAVSGLQVDRCRMFKPEFIDILWIKPEILSFGTEPNLGTWVRRGPAPTTRDEAMPAGAAARGGRPRRGPASSSSQRHRPP